MRVTLALSLALLVLAGGAPAFAADESASDAALHHAQAEARLARGDLAGALEAFTEAARLDPDDKTHANRRRTVERVLALRRAVMEKEVSPRWERAAISVHAWLLQNDLTQAALEVDRLAHAKAGTPLTAALVAEALLHGGAAAEAESFLRGLDPTLLDAQNRLYLGIAMARQARAELARVSEELGPLAEVKPGLLFDVARLSTLVGEEDRALEGLRALMTATPASRQERMRAFVETSPDFAPLRHAAGYEAALATPSGVEDRGCGNCKGDCSKCENGTKGENAPAAPAAAAGTNEPGGEKKATCPCGGKCRTDPSACKCGGNCASRLAAEEEAAKQKRDAAEAVAAPEAPTARKAD